MFIHSYRKLLSTIFIVTCFCFSTTAQVQPELAPERQRASNPYSGKGWTPEQKAAESIARHKFNEQRIQQLKAAGRPVSEAGNISVTDTNDISVVQDNGSVIIPPMPFNLNGRSVLFTPSGSGFNVTGGALSYDTNFGTKLNLSQSPAVQSLNPNAEPGDDSYLVQSLGFNFSYFGTVYSSVAISSNGFITFRPASISNASFDAYSTDSGESLSKLQSAVPRISPYWHDLDARPVSTAGAAGIYLRNDPDKVVITWNNIQDYLNNPSDTGTHRFQVTLFSDGRILWNYNQVQLTTKAVVGLSSGVNSTPPLLVDFANPTNVTTGVAMGQLFSSTTEIDEFNAIKAFYNAHPGQDNFDFVYVLLDFNYTLPEDSFAYYLSLRNDVSGNGQPLFDEDPNGVTGSKRMKGFLQLGSLSEYPDSPTTRFLGANHTLSIFGQEQGHYWLAYPTYPLSSLLLLGRDESHWSFFFNAESGWSHPAAPRGSSAEGSVWRENANGTFTSTNLVDGFSKLDQYLMGLRPSDQVPDSFVIRFPTAPSGINATTGARPNVTVSGTKVTTTIAQIIQANGQVPTPSAAPKKYRAAVLLIEQNGQQPSLSTLNRVTRLRLSWESYFAQSTDFLASINTGVADQTTSRIISVTNGASYTHLVAPGAIASLFGQGLSNTTTLATGSTLPFNLNGIEVKIDGVSAPLFFASPGQINFEVPRSIATTSVVPGGTVQSSTALVEVFSSGQLFRAGAVQIAPALVGTFALTQDGAGAAAALDAINFSAAPFNAKQTNGQPNFIAAYVTGLGADATDTDGDIKAQVQATLNGQAVTLQYAGRAPGFVGLNQINFQLPATVTAGTYNLVISRNGFASNTTTIAIK